MIPKEIIIHHTASSRDKTTFKNVDSWHKLRWPDFKSSLGYWIGYHYLINSKGEVLQARKTNEMGAHCVPNDGKVGICLIGNFEVEKPTEAQLNALEGVLNNIKKDYGLTDDQVYAHCEKSQTLCPGKELKLWIDLNRKVSYLKKIIKQLMKILGSGEN